MEGSQTFQTILAHRLYFFNLRAPSLFRSHIIFHSYRQNRQLRKAACEIFLRNLSGYAQAAITAGDTAALEKLTTYSSKCSGIRSFCPSPRTASRASPALLTTASGSVIYKACSSCFIVSAPPRRSSYFVIRADSLHFRAIRKFANRCFSGAFFTSKTWGSRKRMSKKIRRFCLVRTKQLAFLHRSMVYYAYGLCRSDKNANTGLYPFADAARAPHGDSNNN